jgi:hypothetical protein
MSACAERAQADQDAILQRLSAKSAADMSAWPRLMRNLLQQLGSIQNEEQFVQQWPLVQALVSCHFLAARLPLKLQRW